MTTINKGTFLSDSKKWTLTKLFYDRDTQLNMIQHVCDQLQKTESAYTGKLIHIPLIGKKSVVTMPENSGVRKMCTLNDLVAADTMVNRDKDEDTDFYYVKIELQYYIDHLKRLCGTSITSQLEYIYTILIHLLLSVPLRDIVCANTPTYIADRYLAGFVARIDGQMWGVCKNIENDSDRGKTIIDAQVPIEMVLNELTLYEHILSQTEEYQ